MRFFTCILCEHPLWRHKPSCSYPMLGIKEHWCGCRNDESRQNRMAHKMVRSLRTTWEILDEQYGIVLPAEGNAIDWK